MKTKIFTLMFISSSMFFIAQTQAMAAALPLSGVDVLVKSITSGQVLAASTDDNGNFSVKVGETNGSYNVFIGDESLPPVKVIATNNIVSGRIVILTDGTTTKDPVPVPAKKTIPLKKTTTTKKPKSVTKTIK